MSKISVLSWQIIEFLNDLLEFFENLLEFFFGLSFFGLEFFSKCPKKEPAVMFLVCWLVCSWFKLNLKKGSLNEEILSKNIQQKINLL